MNLARMKTDFVANVSHELRTPLALIRMHAETLEMDRVPDEERKKQYYRTIMSETTRLTQLINNILDFSKIESHKKEYHLESDDLRECLIQTLNVYGYHLRTKGFRLEQKLDPAVPKISMDREAVTQALINLLDNAVKFSQEEKKIIVTLETKQNMVVLSVRDFGVGIPEAEQKKIFDKFYRVENSLVHNTKGSGLGLNLVKHIMNVHNGKVSVTSKEGEGSTFSLYFPKE
jgi:two-component system phosphate regulon sensor histidine kinase PhoR